MSQTQEEIEVATTLKGVEESSVAKRNNGVKTRSDLFHVHRSVPMVPRKSCPARGTGSLHAHEDVIPPLPTVML
jgi:hypothetical protein